MKIDQRWKGAPGLPLGESRRSAFPQGLNPADLPRERMARQGPEALKDHELLALILGTGYRGRNVLEVARAILEARPAAELMGLGLKDLARLKGLGKARAALLVAAIELVKRGLERGLGVLPLISCPAEVVPFLAEIKDQRREHFLCLYLNARNQVVHKEVISIGSLSASIVHPREVFRVALQHAVASLILAHNHPSGDVSPSKDDLELTRRLVKAGELMGIEVLDHLIIGADEFLSLKEKGLM
jgi:DNA repair protein RadC